MTRYVITGRPIGPIVEEITHLGVGATLDADLTPEREAELIASRILKLDETEQETPDGSQPSPEPQPQPDASAGASEPVPDPVEPEPDPTPAGDAGVDENAGDSVS